jgi:hypothetical protein
MAFRGEHADLTPEERRRKIARWDRTLNYAKKKVKSMNQKRNEEELILPIEAIAAAFLAAAHVQRAITAYLKGEVYAEDICQAVHSLLEIGQHTIGLDVDEVDYPYGLGANVKGADANYEIGDRLKYRTWERVEFKNNRLSLWGKDQDEEGDEGDDDSTRTKGAKS